MKIRRVLLLMLATVLLFNCSCQKQPSGQDGVSDVQESQQPEPQRMAYRLSETAYIDNDIYFLAGPSFTKAQIYATEYGSENFDIYIPCFDAVCDHNDREKCCIATTIVGDHTRQFAVLMNNGEPALVLFNPVDVCLSLPYSNVKTTLLCEDYLNADDAWTAYKDWKDSGEKTQRSEPLVYKNYLYYVETKNGIRTQYRVSLEGGEPERIFEEDNVIIRTIINDRFYGIRYDINAATAEQDILSTRDQIHYFRSDMNYENVEPLPEILDFFALQGDVNFSPESNAILDADEEFIYVTKSMKIWAIPDSNIYAEPVLLSDMEGKIPVAFSTINPTTWYNKGIIYSLVNTDQSNRSLLNDQGTSIRPTLWFESSKFYSFDIRTGEYSTWDLEDPNYLMTDVSYADDKYVYGLGIYAHNDNRAIQGVTMRLTLDTMRYEVILPDRFLEYSAETVSE